jgi:pentatricopeptide repeat protein
MWDDPRERGRESYQWKLSQDLMKSAGTLGENSRRDFIRWKRKYRAIPRWTATGTPLGLDATIEDWLQHLDKDEDLRNVFEQTEKPERLGKWPNFMMTILKHRPQKTHLALAATLDPLLPPYAVMDALLFIVSSLPKEEHLYKNEQDHDLARNVVELFSRIKDTFPALPFEQRTLGLAASRLPRRQFERLFTSLEIPLAELHENTALQFARKLAGTIDEASKATSKWAALEILEHLATRGEKVNTDKFRSVVTPLLHHNPPDDEVRPFDTKVAFSSLWDKGFRPNIINVTTYLDTACLAGDVKYAITVAKLFRDHGLPFDSRALDILFRGAKHSNDSALVDELLQLSKAAGIDMFSNALHAILYAYSLEARQHKRYNVPDSRPFLPMLRTYAKRCSLEELQQLIPESLPLMLTQHAEGDQTATTDQRRWEFEHSIVPVVDASFPSLNQKQPESSIGTIAIMFRAYIKSMRRSHELLSLWMTFKLRLEAPWTQDNVAAKLVKHQKSLIHDTFILEMLKHPGFKRPALDVFGDMLNSMLKEKGQSAHPEPSVFTFTILLNRLVTQGEHVLADELYQVMRENGVEPNLATMNTRVKTAAMAQNVDRTVSALSELETIYQPDRWTFKAFGRLRRQQQALKMIQEIIDVRKRQLDAEVQGQ